MSSAKQIKLDFNVKHLGPIDDLVKNFNPYRIVAMFYKKCLKLPFSKALRKNKINLFISNLSIKTCTRNQYYKNV